MANRPADKNFVQLLLLFGLALLASCGSGGSNSNSETTPPPKPTLQSITVSPQNASVAAGLTQQFTATGNYSDGSSAALSTVSWSTSDATVATINSAGLVNTLKQGAATVTISVRRHRRGECSWCGVCLFHQRKRQLNTRVGTARRNPAPPLVDGLRG